jgi:hypothetical protein
LRPWPNYITKAARVQIVNRPGPCIKLMHAMHKRNLARVPNSA